MTTRTIVVGAGTVALVGGAVMALLLVFYGSGTRASLTHADLTGTNLTGTNLGATTIDDADLTFTVFTGAAMAGTLLTGSTWSSETVWADERIKALVTAASTTVGDGSLRIGELTMPAH